MSVSSFVGLIATGIVSLFTILTVVLSYRLIDRKLPRLLVWVMVGVSGILNIGLLLAPDLRGGLAHIYLTGCTTLFIALPLGAAAELLHHICRWRKLCPRIDKVYQTLALWSLFVASFSLSLLPTHLVVQWEIHTAMRYCERLVEDGTLARNSEGKYPAELPPAATAALPRLMDEEYSYETTHDQTEFRLVVFSPLTFIDQLVYESRNGEWTHD